MDNPMTATEILNRTGQMDQGLKSRPIVSLGYQAVDGTIVVTDVLCHNFPDMTDEQMAALSWKLFRWSCAARK